MARRDVGLCIVDGGRGLRGDGDQNVPMGRGIPIGLFQILNADRAQDFIAKDNRHPQPRLRQRSIRDMPS